MEFGRLDKTRILIYESPCTLNLVCLGQHCNSMSKLNKPKFFFKSIIAWYFYLFVYLIN